MSDAVISMPTVFENHLQNVTSSELVSPDGRQSAFKYCFGRLSNQLFAYAFVLPEAIEGRRIFFSTEGGMYFGENGSLYIYDESILLKFDLQLKRVFALNIESAKGWSILSVNDFGKSAKLHYTTYPYNFEEHGHFWFSKGYRCVRNHVLPTGGVIPKAKRKTYLRFIEAQANKRSESSDLIVSGL